MEKVIAISKRMFLELASVSAWQSAVRAGKGLLPTFAPRRRSAPLVPDYGARGDHLFLPDACSIKNHVTVETMLVMYASLVGGILMIHVLADLFSVTALVVLFGLITLFYLAFMFFKLYVIATSLNEPFIAVPQKKLDALTDDELPTYTVLVPLRDEAEVMEQIIEAMERIEYPREKLDLIVTVEQFDHTTKNAMYRAGIPAHWRVLELPDTMPKTKPKALNCAFLAARGEYLVIYDAEIIPDPDQLKKAFLAFTSHPEFAVFQPRLDHYNTYQNLLTRLFTIEFTFHYDMFLPGLSRHRIPVPLSGHSTHFRMRALRESGAWDPYNVAEDCEVGMRLFRQNHRSGILDSLSQEEAASTLSGWIKQRTRWMKGFIQTSIVHLRHPLRTKREMGGWTNFLAFLLVVPGTVVINLLNIIMATFLASWIIFQPAFIQSLFPLPVLYLANVAAIIGGFLFVYLSMIALYRREKFDLIRWWFLIPVYWILLAYATVRAAIQIMTAPHLWEKTTHGTHLARGTAVTYKRP